MAKTKILFDDSYKGPRWTYGLTYRPLTGSHVPEGWIIFSDKKHPDFPFGTVDYPRPLTDHETFNFELTLVKEA